MTRHCAWCQMVFSSNFTVQRYCSKRCANAAGMDRQCTLLRDCDWCGERFRTRPVDPKAHCSKDCAYKAQRGVRRPRDADAAAEAHRLAGQGLRGPEIARVLGVDRHTPSRWLGSSGGLFRCVYCDGEFHAKRKRLHCGAECKALDRILRRVTPIQYKDCRRCGELFVQRGGLDRVYCSELCALRAGQNKYFHVKRSAARVGEVFSLREIAIRDGWRCQLCRKPVSQTKTFPYPKAPVLDHIVPLSRGGEHVRANVHLAHYECNSRKSNGAVGEQLLLFG